MSAGYRAVGTRVYSEDDALVRKFERRRWKPKAKAGEWLDELNGRIRKARRFAAALNGVGPHAEQARQAIGQ